MRNLFALPVLATALALPAQRSLAAGDAARGGELYRGCVACHSLEPGVHLTGPSLADIWGKPAGTVDGYTRYSEGLKAAEFDWDASSLNVWLRDPNAVIDGTYMTFRGIKDDGDRANLIAFLELALVPGGAMAVTGQKLVPAAYVRGQQPQPLAPSPAETTVTAIRHCGDGYFIAMADGGESVHWEKNVRLKIDSTSTGPEPGKPVVAGAGMMGDRLSVIFASTADLTRFVVEKC